MTTVRELAAAMSAAFEERQRPDGERFRALRDGSPDWMRDICFEAHQSMLPDDWTYIFIEDACDLLSATDSADDAFDDIEPSIYTDELTGWLNSRTSRVFYLEEARENAGDSWSGGDLLMLAQLEERREVFQLVLDALDRLAEDMNEEDEETEE